MMLNMMKNMSGIRDVTPSGLRRNRLIGHWAAPNADDEALSGLCEKI